MTEFEKKVLYPGAKKILERMGYNIDEDIHAQFLKRFEKELNSKPSKPFHRTKIYWEKKKALENK